MADRSKIEWTDATWTPVKGCVRKSPGCVNCYAEVLAARFSKPGQWGEGLAAIVETPHGKDHRWTGVVRFDEAELLKPLRWRRARRVFVCSTSDLFQDGVTDEQIDRVFAVMALCPQHSFQVLTKRPERMREWAASRLVDTVYPTMRVLEHPVLVDDAPLSIRADWPLPNVWLGTSVEDQARAAERIPHLLATSAAVRFVSCEPLLERLDLTVIDINGDGVMDALNPTRWADEVEGWRDTSDEWEDDFEDYYGKRPDAVSGTMHPTLDWVIVGGESGPGSRPMHPDWARALRDQCAAAGVPFFFKQIGEWGWPTAARHHEDYASACNGEGPWRGDLLMEADGKILPGTSMQVGSRVYIRKLGKKRSGRLLDGVQHDGVPAVAGASA